MSSRQFYTDRDGCLRRAEDDALTMPVTLSRRKLLVNAGALGLGALSVGSILDALMPNSAAAASNVGETLRAATAGGTLVFAVDSTAGVADPATFTSFGDWMVVDTVCRGLMLIDFKSTKTFGDPDLAQSWTVSDNGLLYQFKLRSGRKFHDGTNVTANDCVRSFNRQLLDRDPTLPVGGTMALRGATGRNISGVRAVGDDTFEIRLIKPDRLLPARLSDVPARIISAAALDQYKDRIGSNLVGAGPFKWGSARAGESIVVDAWSGFPGGKPGVDRIVFQQTADPSALVAGLMTRQIHVSSLAPYNAAAQLAKSTRTRVYDTRKLVSTFVMMNMTKPNLRDLRVRQAINYAIDRGAVIRSAFFGQAELPRGYNISSTEVGFDPKLAKYSTRNVARAKQLVQQANANGLSVEIAAENTSWHPAAAQIVAKNLEEIGLSPKIRLVTAGTFSGVAFDINGHELIVWERNSYVPDPDNKVGNMFESTGTYSRLATGQNVAVDTALNNQIDSLILQARNETNKAKRKTLYTNVQSLLCERVMNCAMLAYARNVVVSASNVADLNADSLSTERAYFDKTKLN
jgi:peptide/nickel transport system substrate-binding protein